MGITYNQIEEIKEIKRGLIEDLIELGKQKGKLQEVDMLAHSIKNLCKVIEDAEMEAEGGFSGRSYSRAVGQSGNSGVYSGYSMAPAIPVIPPYSAGYSMAPIVDPEYAWAQGGGQGGSSGARRRDSMGRYSSHAPLSTEIYSLMGQAKNDMERQELERLAERLRQMEQQ